jgi:hypothetical protein
MCNKTTEREPEGAYAVGFSHVPCVITEEMRVTARDNSLALEDMLTRIALGSDFVVRLRDLSH